MRPEALRSPGQPFRFTRPLAALAVSKKGAIALARGCARQRPGAMESAHPGARPRFKSVLGVDPFAKVQPELRRVCQSAVLESGAAIVRRSIRSDGRQPRSQGQARWCVLRLSQDILGGNPGNALAPIGFGPRTASPGPSPRTRLCARTPFLGIGSRSAARTRSARGAARSGPGRAPVRRSEHAALGRRAGPKAGPGRRRRGEPRTMRQVRHAVIAVRIAARRARRGKLRFPLMGGVGHAAGRHPGSRFPHVQKRRFFSLPQ